MLEINITVTLPDLAAAISALAAAITASRPELNEVTPAPVVNPTQQVTGALSTATVVQPVAPVAEPVIPIIPQPADPVAVPAVAVAPPAPVAAPVAVPTAAPTYTLEMLARAGTSLIDAGKMSALTELLARYGVEALTSLDPAQYGTFATELRALGAQI